MIVDFKDPAVDADDEEYGEVIDRPEGASKSHLTELKTEGRPRGSSFASSSSSLSPNMSPDSAIVSAAQVFPFSTHEFFLATRREQGSVLFAFVYFFPLFRYFGVRLVYV
jgi:hypothetical protein